VATVKRSERAQAQRVAAYVDGVVIQRRDFTRDLEPLRPEDREFDSLRDLVTHLNAIELTPPDGFERDLLRQLPRLAAEHPQTPRSWTDGLRGFLRLAQGGQRWRLGQRATVLPLALALLMAAVAVLTFRFAAETPMVVSAREVVTRSDAALRRLVLPGQLLHRRWSVQQTIDGRAGAETRHLTHTIEEWMDGGDIDRVAGRWYDADGRLLIAYTTHIQDGQHRPSVYFRPGVFNEAAGGLNIEPTRKEFDDALEQFPPPMRRTLQLYLARQYIYQPIIGEREINRAMLEAPNEPTTSLPRVVLSCERTHGEAGEDAFRVRLIDPVSITFNWTSKGPPHVQLRRAEVVRYINAGSYLATRTENSYVYASGQHRTSVHQLVGMETLDTASLSSDPFTLDIPAGTPTRRQSAREQLSSVADALERVDVNRFAPAFGTR
jgi:hypothetical protein